MWAELPAQPPCCWQDKSCWDLQCQAPLPAGQRTGRCVPQAGGTGKSCEVLAWCPVDGGSIRYRCWGWALVGNEAARKSEQALGCWHLPRPAGCKGMLPVWPPWCCSRGLGQGGDACGQLCSLLFLAASPWRRWHHNSPSSSRTTSTSPALASPSEYLWVWGTQPGCPAAGSSWPCCACLAGSMMGMGWTPSHRTHTHMGSAGRARPAPITAPFLKMGSGDTSPGNCAAGRGRCNTRSAEMRGQCRVGLRDGDAGGWPWCP